MPDKLDDFLEHHGVKGMKWGRRKHAAADEAIKTGVADKKMFSRRDVKKLNKATEQEYNLKKTTQVYNESKAKGDNVLVKSRAAGDYVDTVMTGKQFVSHVERGGLVNPASTRVFARRQHEGQQFIQNNFMDEVYRPIKRK